MTAAGARPAYGRSAGFTLLELLLVLALVGMVTAVVAPALGGWTEAARTRSTVDAVHAHVQAQRSLAFHEGRPRELAAASDWPLPAGWRVDLAQPLRWEANGMARGGRLLVWEGADLRADWVVEPLSGAIRPATALDVSPAAALSNALSGVAADAANARTAR